MWSTRSPRWFKLTILAIVLSLYGSIAQAITVSTADVADYLSALDYGSKNAGDWIEPDDISRMRFASGFDYFLAGQMEAAESVLTGLGFALTEYHQGKGKHRRIYYVLHESVRPGNPGFAGSGTYVFNPDGVPLALSAPHPESDLHTEKQAINAFIAVNARYLLMPGVRRDNHIDTSPCTNGSYRKSDASHFDKQYYFVAHDRILVEDAEAVFLEFHGFGSTSLSKLQTQCGVTNGALVNISEGVNQATSPNATSFMHSLRREIAAGNIIAACVYGNDTTSLGATWNTVGRRINGSADVCGLNAAQSSGRFVHLEQSYDVRSLYEEEMQQYLLDAVKAYFGQSRSRSKK